MGNDYSAKVKVKTDQFPGGAIPSLRSSLALLVFGRDAGNFLFCGGRLYGKIFEQTFTGSMMGAGAHVFAVWAYVIANVSFSKIDLNPKYLAAVIGETPEKIMEAIEFLCQPDPYSRSNAEEGRRLIQEGQFQYHVVNHDTYVRIRKAEERREYFKEKQRERRNVNKKFNCQQLSTGVNDVTHPDPDPDPSPNKEKNIHAKPGRKFLSVDDLISEGVDPKHASDWLQVRKAKRAPLTKTAWEAIKSEAMKAHVPVAVAVKYAAENGWQGFKADWIVDKISEQKTLGERLAARNAQ